MKKWLSAILAVMLFCSTTIACAEEFTLRNGIKFGDTMDEVLSKETIEIETIDDGSDEDVTTEEAGDDEEEEEEEYPYSITTENATVAGVNDSYITYRFDAEKRLKEVQYFFRSSSFKDTIDSDYDSVNSALIRKYGNPLGYSGGDCYIFLGSAIKGAALGAYLFKYLDGYGDIRDYDEWDVKADNHHVKIEQVEYYYGGSYSELKYAHQMSYTYFTDEDLQEAQQEKREERAAIDDDI